MDTTAIKERFVRLKPFLNERQRRLAAAAEAQSLGRGGISAVADATGVARKTIARGLQELATPDASLGQRIRRSGGGRKRAVVKDPTLLADLERWVEPVSRGDPESPLRWTSKSVRKLADELMRQGHQVSHTLVANLLKELGYRLQANRKTGEGSAHPDRDAQFEYIQAEVKAFLAAGQPVISVDTKKKEVVGDFKNNGRELRPEGDPEVVHDFVIPELGKVAPYGVYDVTHNLGWANVGIDQDEWYTPDHMPQPKVPLLAYYENQPQLVYVDDNGRWRIYWGRKDHKSTGLLALSASMSACDCTSPIVRRVSVGSARTGANVRQNST